MKLKLPDSVSSSQDVKTLALEVREYARWFSHAAIKKRLDMKHTSQPPAMSPAAEELLRSWDTKQHLSTKSLDELIATLEHFEDTAPSLTIILAAPPPASLKKALVAWCRKNIAPNALVTFQFNSTLLGGMVVRHGSRIFDWSFQRQIMDARESFPEVLRSV